MSFNTNLINLLKTDSRFLDDKEELVLATVQDRAWKIDRHLVKLLLVGREIKVKFIALIGMKLYCKIKSINKVSGYSQREFITKTYSRFCMY